MGLDCLAAVRTFFLTYKIQVLDFATWNLHASWKLEYSYRYCPRLTDVDSAILGNLA
ncbi:hypothetical protein BVRB_2g034100 [Beta vulgaris subsp. vulgaris]|nr:hypothetical protein BVRB_2g034100 [Beta vulgaris subsp. vulgaris]